MEYLRLHPTFERDMRRPAFDRLCELLGDVSFFTQEGSPVLFPEAKRTPATLAFYNYSLLMLTPKQTSCDIELGPAMLDAVRAGAVIPKNLYRTVPEGVGALALDFTKDVTIRDQYGLPFDVAQVLLFPRPTQIHEFCRDHGR